MGEIIINVDFSIKKQNIKILYAQDNVINFLSLEKRITNLIKDVLHFREIAKSEIEVKNYFIEKIAISDIDVNYDRAIFAQGHGNIETPSKLNISSRQHPALFNIELEFCTKYIKLLKILYEGSPELYRKIMFEHRKFSKIGNYQIANIKNLIHNAKIEINRMKLAHKLSYFDEQLELLFNDIEYGIVKTIYNGSYIDAVCIYTREKKEFNDYQANLISLLFPFFQRFCLPKESYLWVATFDLNRKVNIIYTNNHKLSDETCRESLYFVNITHKNKESNYKKTYQFHIGKNEEFFNLYIIRVVDKKDNCFYAVSVCEDKIVNKFIVNSIDYNR